MSGNVRHSRFVSALLEGQSIADAAASAGVCERTGFRWLALPDMRETLGGAIASANWQASANLAGMKGKAVRVLDELLDANPVPNRAGVKLRAAQLVLELGIKLTELTTLEDRVALLEQRGGDNGKT